MRDYNYNPNAPIFDGSSYWTKGVKWLIIANAVMFGIQIVCWKLLPFELEAYLALSPRKVIYDFWLWQPLTCAFLHSVIFPTHILFNMLMLFFFGFLVEGYLGTRRFLHFYFFSAVFASMVYVGCEFFTNTSTLAIGASGAIMGVMVMAACLYPHNIVYLMGMIPLRLRTIIWILVGLDMYQALLLPANSVAVTGHLGGALFGYLYYRFADPLREYWSRHDQRQTRPARAAQPKTQAKLEDLRQEVDRILDKVSREGMNSLSSKEREFLQKASKQYQREI